MSENNKEQDPLLGCSGVVLPSTSDLRVQATLCRNQRAAAILASVASWLEGKPATDGDMEPYQFADLWTEAPCALDWVSSAEAATWPEGSQVLMRRKYATGGVSYAVISNHRPDYILAYADPQIEYTFARLE